MSSKRTAAAESLAFFTLGIASPMHSSIHPLSEVFTRTANVNLFACAGPPSWTHLQKVYPTNSVHRKLAINNFILQIDD